HFVADAAEKGEPVLEHPLGAAEIAFAVRHATEEIQRVPHEREVAALLRDRQRALTRLAALGQPGETEQRFGALAVQTGERRGRLDATLFAQHLAALRECRLAIALRQTARNGFGLEHGALSGGEGARL